MCRLTISIVSSLLLLFTELHPSLRCRRANIAHRLVFLADNIGCDLPKKKEGCGSYCTFTCAVPDTPSTGATTDEDSPKWATELPSQKYMKGSAEGYTGLPPTQWSPGPREGMYSANFIQTDTLGVAARLCGNVISVKTQMCPAQKGAYATSVHYTQVPLMWKREIGSNYPLWSGGGCSSAWSSALLLLNDDRG